MDDGFGFCGTIIILASAFGIMVGFCPLGSRWSHQRIPGPLSLTRFFVNAVRFFME
jgi:hypothetical protein